MNKITVEQLVSPALWSKLRLESFQRYPRLNTANFFPLPPTK
jgi:hypothetical protein